MVVSKDDLLKQVKDYLKEDTSDEAITLLENVSDTLNSMSSEDIEELKKQLAEANEKADKIDKEWRVKYTDRFNSPAPKSEKKGGFEEPDETDDDEEEDEPTKYEDLFTTKSE